MLFFLSNSIFRDYRIPFVPVHHMKAHALAARLVDAELKFPFLCLLISGGHSIICIAQNPNDFTILGQTINISPGEAIDKVARSAGIIPLTHYGSAVEELAKQWVFFAGMDFNLIFQI
jgi:N6-L-threonylcarbamoyladenine synthase